MKKFLSLISCFTMILSALGMVAPAAIAEEDLNLYGDAPIALSAGTTYFFGPLDAGATLLGTFNGAPLSAADVEEIGTFMRGQKLYSYTPSAGGEFIPAVADAYKEMYLLAEGEGSIEAYHAYWDDRGGNLYNEALDGINGFYTSATGRNTTANHRSTHFIAVEPGDTITFGPANPNQGWHGITLAADGSIKDEKIEKAELAASSGSVQNGLVFYTYTVPEGAASISLIMYTPVQSFFLALKNAPALTPDSYYAHQGVTTDPLYGKTALFVGDSISYGENDSVQNSIRLAWAGRVGLSHGLTYTNASVSGTSLSTMRGENSRILNQINGKAGNRYDFVVIHGGVNDAWGNAGDGYIPAPIGKMTEGFGGSYDKTTYAGGLEQTFAAAKANFPDAKLIYIMNFKASECPRGTVSDMSAYFAEGAKICEKWGVTVCDLYSRYNFDDPAYLDDRMIHINQYGYDIVYPHVADAMMASVLADPLMEKIAEFDLLDASLVKKYQDAKKDFEALPGGVWEYIENRSMLTAAEVRLENAKVGDLNLDDEINMQDLVRLLRYQNDLISADALHLAKGDLTGEGAVDTADIIALARTFMRA